MRLIEGDCLQVLPTLGLDPARTAVVSDPPYGMRNNTDSKRFTGGRERSNRRFGAGRNDWPQVIGDGRPFDPTPWLAFPKVILWGANHFGRRLPAGTTLVWLKKADHLFGTFLSDAEVGWQKGGCGVWCFRETGGNSRRRKEGGGTKLHPNQKPVALMRWCIERLKVPAGWTILDPYAGSGTTGIAASQLGYDFVGIEAGLEYAAAARRRLEAPALGAA